MVVRHPPEEARVLRIDRLVEAEGLPRELDADRRRPLAARVPRGIDRDDEEDDVGDDRDDDEEPDRPQHTSDHVAEHAGSTPYVAAYTWSRAGSTGHLE